MTTTVARPLICVRALNLTDQLTRLATTAGVDVDVANDPTAARPLWTTARIVIVGADVATEYAAARLPHRSGLILVADERAIPSDAPIIWQIAAELDSEYVTFVPTAEAWLIQSLAASPR
ncbi:hypothetical protein [Cryptosporangium phraense]|uniref:Rv3660c-like CheY-like N-terminal domain-containing protein n=1 Tax=Cryptosporangium phraense TaxID=2593070 RepID=A0A545ANH0_9ACTN|nr:hypothetical protein [Cryptosporangium phraense]TQS42836.1 hypothetical protein FL583_22560 [Cryptosporangium phraense]